MVKQNTMNKFSLLGSLILGALLSFLLCEGKILSQTQHIEDQAKIINAYDKYWHSLEDEPELLNFSDRFEPEDSLVYNYSIARENLVRITNYYESNLKHIHK